MTNDELDDFRTSVAYFLKTRGVRLAFAVDYLASSNWVKVSWELGGSPYYSSYNLNHDAMPRPLDEIAHNASKSIVASVIERGLAHKEAVAA